MSQFISVPKAVLLLSAANLLSGGLFASTIGSFTSTDVRVNPGAFDTVNPAVTQSDPVFSTASLTTTFNPGTGIGNSSFDGSAKASAAFGLLRTFVTADLTNYQAESYSMSCGVNSFCSTSGGDPVNADASFTDTLTINGGVGTGYLVMDFSVDGTTNLVTGLNFFTTSQGALLVEDGSNIALNSGFRGGTTNLATTPIQFTYGTPFNIFVQDSSFLATLDYDTTNSPYNLSGTADFFNTVVLSSLGVFSDPNATDQVNNFSVTASSNTVYPTAAVATPEPHGLVSERWRYAGSVHAPPSSAIVERNKTIREHGWLDVAAYRRSIPLIKGARRKSAGKPFAALSFAERTAFPRQLDAAAQAAGLGASFFNASRAAVSNCLREPSHDSNVLSAGRRSSWK